VIAAQLDYFDHDDSAISTVINRLEAPNVPNNAHHGFQPPAHSSTMGNVHSGSALTRTTVALDSYVAELGGDIIFEKKCVAISSISYFSHSVSKKLGFSAIYEDCKMPSSERISCYQDIH
jgi:hypothetical protein